MPEAFGEFGRTWQEHHPGWKMRLWTEADLPEFENQDLYDRAEELTSGNPLQLRSDIARYEILWRFGGVYVDCDFECRRGINRLIGRIKAFAAWERQYVWVNNAILGSVSGGKFVRRCIDELPASVKRHRRQRPNVSSGPQYVTRLYRQHHRELTVFDEALFYPYACDELGRAEESFPFACAVHHWSNQRRLHGRPLVRG